MRFHNSDEPVYVISVASRLLGTHPHVLRMLEREGLLMPARTESNIRLYSENDLLRLSRICRLMYEERVNVAGVRRILQMETRHGSVTVTVENVQTEDDDNRDDERARKPTPSSKNGWF